MSSPPVGLLLPDTEDTTAVKYARRAEELGYDSVWMVELWGANAFVELTQIATQTTSIEVGTAIANVFSRSPAVLAMSAASLHQISGGQFRLGLGVSTPKVIEDLHGMQFDRPVRRAHETLEIIRAFTDSDTASVEYQNQLFEVAGFPPLGVDIPIYHAALGPANRRVVGRLADGWIPHNIPFSELEATFETIAETANERERDPRNITVAPYVPVAVADNEGDARDAIRGHLAYYVGSGKGYERAVSSVFPDVAERVATDWRAGNRSAAKAAVTDEMVDALSIVGTPPTASERFQTFLDEHAIVDLPILTVPRQADEQLVQRTIEAFAPSRVFSTS